MDKGKFICTLIAIVLAYVHHSQAAAAVSATSCGGGCTVDHSECDGADTPMCKCSDGYKEDSSDQSTCVIIPVSETSCGSNNPVCQFDNSECVGTQTPLCKCSAGYKEDSNDKRTCVKIPVSETSCGSDDPVCQFVNSECVGTQTPLCKCSAGYKEDSNDKSTCVKIQVAVTDTTCDNGKTDCKVEHSECDDVPNTPKCKCSDGYKKDPNNESSCVKIPAVLETACPSGNNDCTSVNSVCDGADTSPKCKCLDGFRQDTKDHTKCKKELGQTCSKGECLTDAQCDTTCKCSDEHIEKDGLCVIPSSTIKAGLSEMVMMMWVLCVIILKLF